MLGAVAADEREQQITAFLETCNLVNYQREKLAADASFRRYERIATVGQSYILMDAPPPLERTEPFADITQRLINSGLHAPAIYSADHNTGLMLLEDLGNASFNAHLRTHADEGWPLYRSAIDVLLHLRNAPELCEGLAEYTTQEYLRELDIFAQWVLHDEAEREEFRTLWRELLARCPLPQTHLVLRDYHADNLMWMPDADGLLRVGLLDYQDALSGDPAYDVVSLLEDARREVPEALAEKAVNYYLSCSGEVENSFRLRYCVLGAQRNFKILGIFNRLSQRDGKRHYLAHLPRVWGYLARDLKHPALETLQSWCQSHLHDLPR